MERLKDTADEAAFADLAHVLYDQAMLAEGGELDDPATFVRRVNRLIVEGLRGAAENHLELRHADTAVGSRRRTRHGSSVRRRCALLDAYSGAVIGALERVAPAVTFIEVVHAASRAPGARRRRAAQAAVRVSCSRPTAIC